MDVWVALKCVLRQAISGILLIMVGASGDTDADIAPEWILGTCFWSSVSWMLVFLYSEKARKMQVLDVAQSAY